MSANIHHPKGDLLMSELMKEREQKNMYRQLSEDETLRADLAEIRILFEREEKEKALAQAATYKSQLDDIEALGKEMELQQ